jgi:hypothetical protein
MGVTIRSDGSFVPEAAQNDDGPNNDGGTNPASEHAEHAHREQFPFAYLPDDVREIFDEALQCYAADLFNAFAAMCRLTAARSSSVLGDADAAHWQQAFAEIVKIGDIDDSAAATIEQLLFGPEADIPMIDVTLAAVLLEVVKDVLYQSHVRAAKFRAAMRVRRFFAQEQIGRLAGGRRARGGGIAD